jgi:hypothetical protein
MNKIYNAIFYILLKKDYLHHKFICEQTKGYCERRQYCRFSKQLARVA